MKFTKEFEVTAADAFRMLCSTLDMYSVMDEDGDYIIKDGKLYQKVWGDYELIDDRGALFVALRNVAVNMFPNTLFRSAPYIYDIEVSDNEAR